MNCTSWPATRRKATALGVLGRAAAELIALTGTLMGGYADDLFNIFYRMEPHAMAARRLCLRRSKDGGTSRSSTACSKPSRRCGREDNACSRATKKTVQVVRKPGASPLLFGKFLMNTTAFLSLEDIADNLPRYDESVSRSRWTTSLPKPTRNSKRISAPRCSGTSRQQEPDEHAAQHAPALSRSSLRFRGDLGAGLRSSRRKSMYKFLVARPAELARERLLSPKRRALIADVQEELRQGRRCQVYATYTGEKDVNAAAGRRCCGRRGSALPSCALRFPREKREEWYERQLKAGVEVVICHPKLVETGLDLLAFPTLYFYETGYSLHTLRQASRRSWRIGQRHPVRVKFVTYTGTMQETCLRLMGKKMLVALMMEGKFSGEGLQSLDADEDLMSAMARELVEKAGCRGICGCRSGANLIGNVRNRWGQGFQRSRGTEIVMILSLRSDLALMSSTGIHLIESAPAKKRKDAPPGRGRQKQMDRSSSVSSTERTHYNSEVKIMSDERVKIRCPQLRTGPMEGSGQLPTLWKGSAGADREDCRTSSGEGRDPAGPAMPPQARTGLQTDFRSHGTAATTRRRRESSHHAQRDFRGRGLSDDG